MANNKNTRSVKILNRYVVLMNGDKEVHSFGWGNTRELSQWNTLIKNWIVFGVKHDGNNQY